MIHATVPPTPEPQPPAPPLTAEDRVVNLERQLRDTRTFLEMALASNAIAPLRRAQAGEQVDNITECLELHGDPHLLARIELLERVAVTAHKLTSERGLPGELRTLADTLERINAALDGSGYDEWDQIFGLDE
jgi:hypothetical protein